MLTVNQRTWNQHISSDRVLFENYFGRLSSFILFGSNWRWDEENIMPFYHYLLCYLMLTKYGIIYKRLMDNCIVLYETV